MKYNHFQYCESLARRLKAIAHTDDDCHFFRATEQSSLSELEENINAAHGMILVAIDGKFSQLDYNADSLVEKPMYGIVVAMQTDRTNVETSFHAQEESKSVAMQIVSRMLCDARDYRHGCEFIENNSFVIEGFGPIAGYFYGVLLSFTLASGIEYKVNSDMWL